MYTPAVYRFIYEEVQEEDGGKNVPTGNVLCAMAERYVCVME